MQQNNCQLRAIVASTDGGFEAQLLELDIAVQSSTVDGLLKELGHALTVSFDVSTELGETPFANLGCAPWNFQRRWHEDGGGIKDEHEIEVPEEVAKALAAILRTPKPVHTIILENIAA
jgi:hypothetical protein